MERLDHGRTLRALHADEMRQATDLGEALIESEEERSVADGDKDVVGHAVIQLMIDLVRHALDTVGKERVVDV